MRKAVLLFVVTFTCFIYLKSQISFGVYASWISSWRSGYDSSNKTHDIATLGGGLFVKKNIGRKLMVHSTLGYFPKGIKFDPINFTDNQGNNIGEGRIKVRFDYLEYNLCLSHEIPNIFSNIFNDPGLRIFLGLGPYVSYAMGGNTKVTKFKSSTGSSKPSLDDPDFALNSRFDAGISFQYLTTNGHGDLGSVSFDLGVVDIDKTNSTKAMTRSVSLSYCIALTGRIFGHPHHAKSIAQ